jgi:hypothetical protein
VGVGGAEGRVARGGVGVHAEEGGEVEGEEGADSLDEGGGSGFTGHC